MIYILAILVFLVFLFLSSIHVYWGFGGRWGSQAVFPTKDDATPPVNPGPIPTFIVAFGLLGFGLFVLVKSGLIAFALPLWLDTYGLWIIAGIFLLRAVGEFTYVGFFKKYTQTKFAKNDTKYYSPLCALLGLSIIILQFLILETVLK